MKAALIHHYGGPEVLTIEDRPEPKLGRDDVLISVVAASLSKHPATIASSPAARASKTATTPARATPTAALVAAAASFAAVWGRVVSAPANALVRKLR